MTDRNKPDFSRLDFDGFRDLARDSRLSRYERIGFPDSYREGLEPRIFQDILTKLPRLNSRDLTVMDIGPGCSDLPHMLIEYAKQQGHHLILVDAPEMLDQLPHTPNQTRIPGRFPDCAEALEPWWAQVDILICYSVFHYVVPDRDWLLFIDHAMALLADGGEMLIGDIPNISKRKRFLASPAGIAFHQAFMNTSEAPEVTFNRVEPGQIDDTLLMSVVMRARSSGYDAYWLPQDSSLPMANRREDLLIRKP